MKINMLARSLKFLFLVLIIVIFNSNSSFAVKPGSLYITSKPSGATVYLDNTKIGKTEVVIGAIPAGTHKIRLELAGHKKVEKIVKVRSGLTTTIPLVLAREGGKPQGEYKVASPITTTLKHFVEIINNLNNNPWVILLIILSLTGIIVLTLIVKFIPKRRRPALEAKTTRRSKRPAKVKAPSRPLRIPTPAKGINLKKAPVLGNYRVVGKIASGGMANIYKATHIRKGGTAVLKVPYEQYQNDRNFIERFRREAELGKKLHSENIIRIYESGTSKNGLTYIAMEYLQGIDLRQYLDKYGRMPINEALRMIVHVCRALDYAHVKGVVHRDIKPENIMLPGKRGKGKVVLMDFGVAHAAYLGTVGTRSTYLGTPFYMSPDQLSRQKVDGRSDIYSLGVVFFEILTGQRPFYDSDPLKVLIQHRESPPPKPRSLSSEIPAALEKIVLKMLAKRPKDRYKNVEDLLVALQDYMLREGVAVD